MNVLDCGTMESTFSSITNLLDLSKNIIINEMLENNFEQEFFNSSLHYEYEGDFWLYILDYFFDMYHLKINNLDRVYWFHLTRYINKNTFKNGLYPLDQMLDKLFNDLYFLVSEKIDYTDWMRKDIGAKGENAIPYCTRLSDLSTYGGPHAFLIKEIGVTACSHFLRTPEIIEDIGSGVENVYGIPFTEEFIKRSKPMVVKFFSAPDRDIKDYLKSVFKYIYEGIRNEEFDNETCFYNAHNEVVPKNQIVNIEIIKNFK